MEKGPTPRHFFVSSALILLLIAFVFEVPVQAQDQSGFISIDCGLPANSSYTDPITGIKYISDAEFIDTGVPKEIYDKDDYYAQQLWHLRSFPKGVRNCYTLNNVRKGQRYLIRAHFYYGDYDSKNTVPEFDLYLGVSLWARVSDGMAFYKEIIHSVSTNRLHLCLVDKGKGAPYISAIELRPLPSNKYNDNSVISITGIGGRGSLLTLQRLDMGNQGGGSSRDVVRYNKGDIYDRIWEPYYGDGTVQTTMPVNTADELIDVIPPPSTVMMTAATPVDPEQPLTYDYPDSYKNDSINPTAFYVYLYFAELQKLTPNQSRVFQIMPSPSIVSPPYLTTIVESLGYYPGAKGPEHSRLSFVRVKNSTLAPLINAIEVFEGITITDSQTQEEEVDAMMKVKSVYNVTRNWQGDPCAPEVFKWNGLNCALDASKTSSIISLNLSSAELTGNISSYISNLTSLQVLDLSNNDLIGPVPDFLVDMQFLKVLNLSGNNLKGSVPKKLLQKSNRRSLTLSLDGNPYLCKKEACNGAKEKKLLAIKVGTAAGGSILIILFATMAIFWHLRFHRNRRPGPLHGANSRRIRYSEIAHVTDNFKTIIGEGGFGKVYLGQLGGTQVAVKMLSASSFQGYKEFQAEAELLMRVHHRNLISLIGYCNEDDHLGLVYEYMARGNLRMHLSERKENTLTWEQRLQIATDAAQGLDYLHRGCRPPMIHRDVKSSNILINEQFNGKVADFGLSRASPLAGRHETTTVVAGTPGYLDPEYFATNKLNEKSDVYSFGIVLMEIVTCRAVIGTSPEDHIIQYVNNMISTGDISRITDPRLEGDADVNSVRRVLELANICVAQESNRRPTMNQVAMELEECLASIRNRGGEIIDSSEEVNSSNSSTESGPLAR